MESNYTPQQTIPLWKWILELILGSIVFAILYGLGMGLLSAPQPTLKCAAMLFAGAVILAIFPLWIKLFEKQWRWDLLTMHAGKNLFCGVSIGFLFFVVLSCILYVTGCYSAQFASPHWSYILVNLCFYFLVACGEEVIFRGLIFRMIDERFGLWWALGISALVFGFAHMINPSASIWSSVAIAIDIKEKYEAKYGTVSAGNPKVFFKYFFVNTATGEKSGEMLAVAKFAATNGQPEPENQNPGGQSEGGNQGGGAGGDENPEQGLGF